MDLELQDHIAVVTGAGRGIGLAVTETLVAEGACVVAASRTRTPELEALGDAVLHVEADLREPEAPAEVIARAVEVYGGVDVLVNNAGGPTADAPLPHGGFLTRGDEQWRSILEFNLLSAVRASRAALPVLLERGGGAIVNVTSVNGRMPASVNVDYSAAKAALIALTRALSEEFGPQGVRVNGVCPGPTMTPWWTDPGGAAETFAGMVGSDAESVLTTVAPEMMQLTTGRLATAQEVADAVAWLASPRAASTTGSEILVDSGMHKAA